MNGPPEAGSPFALLDEVEEAKELLILSYTTSLDFFERFALSHARALGARVTVISDATMVRADPVTVRRAGSAYLDARAICPDGAFHPKLFVLAGDGDARVGIGSGNLTMAGWHGNAELLTVLRAGPEGAPGTIHEVADFLRRLGGSPIVLGPGGKTALDRVAERLAAIPADLPGPRLLDNLEAPILDALPAGATDELTCAAPFYDRDFAGLKALLDRLSPSHLSLLLESRTSVDGAGLARLMRDRRGTLRWILDEDRYHHGKLFEWAGPDGRWSLTGSPNISRPALLASVAEGGNCELALLSRAETSLAPASEVGDESSALDLHFEPGDGPEAAGVLLLAALRHGDELHLSLHRPAERAGRIEAYSTGTDAWRTVTEFEPGHDRYVIGAESLPVGTAVRILLKDGEASNHVFVSDLTRVTRPQMEAIGRARASAEEIAAHGLGGQLLADVEELRGHLLRVGALVPAVGREREEADADSAENQEPMARPAPSQTLEDYLAACDPVLGRELSEFALVLPAVPGVEGGFDVEASGFDEELDDDRAAESDDADDKSAETSLGEVLAGLPAKERERWRRWVEKLVARSPRLPMIVRTLALRSVLHGVAEEIWDEEVAAHLLADATKALTAETDEPTAAELAAAGSLGAIAVTWIRDGVYRLSIRDEYTLLYEEVAAAIGPILEFRDPEQIGALADAMPHQDLAYGWVEACEQVAEEIDRPQSGPELSVRLLEQEYEIEAAVTPAGTIELLDPVPPAAEPTLCRALGLANEAGPVLAEGALASGTQVLAGWSAPHLVVERRRDGRRWGDLYTLSPTVSPLTYANFDNGLPRPTTSWQGDEPPAGPAAELLGPC